MSKGSENSGLRWPDVLRQIGAMEREHHVRLRISMVPLVSAGSTPEAAWYIHVYTSEGKRYHGAPHVQHMFPTSEARTVESLLFRMLHALDGELEDWRRRKYDDGATARTELARPDLFDVLTGYVGSIPE